MVMRFHSPLVYQCPEYKYLGLIFDKKLSFIPNINYIKAKCHKALNMMKVLSHTTWGCRSNNTLAIISVFNPVKIRLQIHSLWISKKILFSYA